MLFLWTAWHDIFFADPQEKIRLQADKLCLICNVLLSLLFK